MGQWPRADTAREDGWVAGDAAAAGLRSGCGARVGRGRGASRAAHALPRVG